MKDISKTLYCFTKDLYSHRDDLTIQVVRTIKDRKPFYGIHFLVHIKPTDGIYVMLNKGIDRFRLRQEILSFFNLGDNDFSITYQNVYPT